MSSIRISQSFNAAAANNSYKVISAATTNGALVATGPRNVTDIILSNVTAAYKYVKFYNKATAPTVGTDVPRHTIAIPPNQTVTINLSGGLNLPLGLGIAITGAAADADATAVAAGDVIANIIYV